MAHGDRGGTLASPPKQRARRAPTPAAAPVRPDDRARPPRTPPPTRPDDRAVGARSTPRPVHDEIRNVLRLHAEGRLPYAQARQRLLDLGFGPVVAAQGRNPGRTELGPGGAVERLVGRSLVGMEENALGLMPGLVRAATHPIDTGEAIKQQYGHTYGPLVHGDFGEFAHRVGEDPLGVSLDAAALLSAGVGAAARVSSLARVARTGEIAGRAVEAESINPAFRALGRRGSLAAHGFTHPQTRGLLEAYTKRRGVGDVDELSGIADEITEAFQTRPAKSSFGQRAAAARAAHASSRYGSLWNEALDGVRTGAIYLHASYLPNNWAGNTFMNLVQQGFLAPLNLGKSFVVAKKLGAQRTRALDAAIGQTAAHAVQGESATFVRSVTDPLVNVLGRGGDILFRRAAFLHEARRAGYRTLGQVQRLIDEATSNAAAGGRAARNARMRELAEIARRSQEEIVRFGKLGEREQQLAKNVFFVYPWVKGAARYGRRFPLQHPLQAAAYNRVGEVGASSQEQLPERLRGRVIVGHDKNGNPYVVNALGTSPLGTALDVWHAVRGTVQVVTGGRIGGAFDAFRDSDVLSQTNPLIQGYVKAREGGALTDYPKAIAESNSLVRLGEGVTGHGGSKIFPGSPAEALGTWGLGLYPRKADKVELARTAAEDRRRMIAARFSVSERTYRHDLAEAQAHAKRFRMAGGKVPQEIVDELQWRRDLDAELDFAAHKSDNGKVAARLRAEIAAKHFIARFPGAETPVKNALKDAVTERDLEHLYDEIRGEALRDLSDWNEEINAALEEAALAKAK